MTECCVAPTGLLYWGIRFSTGVNTPAYAVSPCGLIICRGQAHKEPVPEWLPPFREKLRVGSLIPDLIRNLLRNNKTQIPRYGDNINNPLSLCASVLKSQWAGTGTPSGRASPRVDLPQVKHRDKEAQSNLILRLIISKTFISLVFFVSFLYICKVI